MSGKKKARPSAATPERAEETAATTNDQKFSCSHDNTSQEWAQEGYISQFLLVGAGQGIHLRDLACVTGRTEREVRQMIQVERLRGMPILSDNQSGYFLPGSEAEKTAFIQSMRHRADEIHRAAEAVEKGGQDFGSVERSSRIHDLPRGGNHVFVDAGSRRSNGD